MHMKLRIYKNIPNTLENSFGFLKHIPDLQNGIIKSYFILNVLGNNPNFFSMFLTFERYEKKTFN